MSLLPQQQKDELALANCEAPSSKRCRLVPDHSHRTCLLTAAFPLPHCPPLTPSVCLDQP